jgi:hypothetical protein
MLPIHPAVVGAKRVCDVGYYSGGNRYVGLNFTFA